MDINAVQALVLNKKKYNIWTLKNVKICKTAMNKKNKAKKEAVKFIIAVKKQI